MNQGNEKAEVKKQTTLRLPAELYEALNDMKELTGFSITTLIFLSVWNSVIKTF
ncbi:hypothetical protein LMK19_001876 [Listeria monocytogenes]|nr:hypothetical protein [Listeria monocytogenes]